jgi:hypothetical protein
MFAKINVADVTVGAARAAVLALALIAVTVSAHAQQTQPSANAIKIAREILDLKKSIDLFGPIVPGVIERVQGMLAQTNPTLGKDLDAVAANLRKAFAPQTAELMNNISRLYASRFTEAELKEIVTFYRTPTGKKVIALEPEVFDDAVADLKVWQEKFSEVVFVRFRAEMKKRGHNL